VADSNGGEKRELWSTVDGRQEEEAGQHGGG
jgi:hypothetical protein